MTDMNTSQALLVMHAQPPLTGYAADRSWIDRIEAAIGAARASGVRIIFVAVGFRAGYPEMSVDNPRRQMLESSQLLLRGISNSFDPQVAPRAEDVIVETTRLNAFVGTDLAEILRSQGIRHLVLAGISTGGVVLSTLVHAFDHDFGATVLSDACTDSDRNTHDALLKHFSSNAPLDATVITTDEWVESLR